MNSRNSNSTKTPCKAEVDKDDLYDGQYFPSYLGLKKMVFFRKVPASPSERDEGKSKTERVKISIPKAWSKNRSLKDDEEEVCSINDSPARLFKLATVGNATELEKILHQNPDRIKVTDIDGNTLLHIAALNGKSSLCDLLVERGCAVDAQNNDGNAPLHLAAMKNETKSVMALLALKAGNCIRNEQMDTPMHIAVRYNSYASLDCFLQACNGNVNKPGSNGKTPLHVAAMLDYVEITKLLIAHGADVLHGCYSGCKAIHSAAYRGSSQVMKYFLTDPSFPTETLVRATDDEKRTSLHTAVTNGNIDCVKLLLEHGADLGAQMYDLSSPLHLACSQGYLAVVVQLYNSSSADFARVLAQKDTQGMTPLHRATMFDHVSTAEYLLTKGAAKEEGDKEGRTPLILSASRGSWGVLALLLRSGANASAVDCKQKNFLHYYILSDAPDLCEHMRSLSATYATLLDQKDSSGCTPLHYAAQNGLLKSSDGLVRLGASLDVKNKQNQSALHFAAKYGRYNTVKRLLEKGVNIINESDYEGSTSLHLAAENGHSNVVQLLMSKGALIHRNYAGKTPLHLASKNNHRETVIMIMIHYGHLVNCSDKDGNTAIHLAAAENATKTLAHLLSSAKFTYNNDGLSAIDWAIQRKHQEACLTMVNHERWVEILTMPSKIYGWPVLGLIEHLPEICTAALDKCITRANCHPLSKSYFIHFDFTLLEPEGLDLMLKDAQQGKDHTKQLTALNHMVKHRKTELLSHPVTGSYLNKKWTTYGIWLYGFNVGLYTTFLTLLTFLIIVGVRESLLPKLKMTSVVNVKNFSMANHSFDMQNPRMQAWMETKEESSVYQTVALMVAIFTILNMIKECVQVYHMKLAYFMDGTNYLEWFLYISTTIFSIGGYGEMEHQLDWKIRWQLGAFAIFAAWLNFMLYLQRFGLMGIYVVMFLGILKTLLRALFVFVFLIIAFSLAFHVLLPLMIYPDSQIYFLKPDLMIDVSMLRSPHQNIWHSILRITSMMLGDLDSINNYIYPMADSTLPFPNATFFFVVAFVVTMSILLMNLLIGLAVGDIEKVLQSATLRRLGMQVELHTTLENRLPKWFLKPVRGSKYYPNCAGICSRNLWDIANDQDIAVGSEHGRHLQAEIIKQRKKFKEVKIKLDQQYDLLRLIVSKMDITDEADQLDEGSCRTTIDKLFHQNQNAPKSRSWISKNTLAKVKSAKAFETLCKPADK